MKYLFDTHAYLWWVLADPRISTGTRDLLTRESSELYFSAASAWELATKFRLGKLPQAQEITSQLGKSLAEAEIVPLPISVEHGRVAGSYANPHRDPFDRILAAQCQIESLVLVTLDPIFAEFPVKTHW